LKRRSQSLARTGKSFVNGRSISAYWFRVERKKNLEQSQATSIKKRNDNIAMRAQARKDKKMGIKDKGKKSGSGGAKGGKPNKKRPGFEGGKGKGRKEQA
jgi:hypothetical protein